MLRPMAKKLLADVRVAIACMFFGLGLQLVSFAGQLDQYLWPGGFASTGVICGLLVGMIIGLVLPIRWAGSGALQRIKQIQISRSMPIGSASMSVLACELLAVTMVVAAMVAALQCAGLAYLGRSIQAVPEKILLEPAEWIALVFGGSGLGSLPSGLIAGISAAIAFYLLLASAGRKAETAGYFQAVLANVTVWMAGSLGVGCVAAGALGAVGLVNSQVILLGCISQLLAALCAAVYTARDVSGQSPGSRKDGPMPLKIIRRRGGPEVTAGSRMIVPLVLIVGGSLLGWWGQLWWRVIKDWASATDGLLVDGYEKMVLGAMAVGWLCGLCLGQGRSQG